MNKQLQELAKQADGVFIHKLMTGAKQYTFLEKDLEKFAKLIVGECCAEIRKQDLPIPVNSYWMNKIAERIEKIFQE
jgi:hypothetical protein